MILGHLTGVAKPGMDDVGWFLPHEFRLAAGP
jgi:hypothetical protein